MCTDCGLSGVTDAAAASKCGVVCIHIFTLHARDLYNPTGVDLYTSLHVSNHQRYVRAKNVKILALPSSSSQGFCMHGEIYGSKSLKGISSESGNNTEPCCCHTVIILCENGDW